MPTPPSSDVARRRRSSARAALYLSLLTVALLIALIYLAMRPRIHFGLETEWADIDWAVMPEVQMLQEYIRINTSTPPAGDPVAGARWVADQLAEMGLEPTLEVVGQEANVWAVLEGRSPEAIVLHHHIDTDPVPRPELWEHDPYGGEIYGPWLFGRGAFDMKSVAVAQLLAVRRLIESGEPPERSVIVLATTGEEAGSDLGTKWVLRNHPELVERFAVVLTEGGAVEGRSLENLKFWGTEFVQKRLVDVTLCGPGGLLDATAENLVELGLTRTEPELVPEVDRFLEAYAPSRDWEGLREMLAEPQGLIDDPQTFSELSEYQASFFVNQAFLRGPVDTPSGPVLRLRMVLLPGEDPETVLDEILPPWTRHGLAVQVFDEGGAGHGSPVDHWAFRGIDEVMARMRPDVPHGPLVLTLTVTDARFFRAAGVPTFGFSPFGVLTAEVVQLRKHGTANERMPLIGYAEGVELYGEVLERLANG